MKSVFAKFVSLAVLLAAGFAFAAGETGVARRINLAILLGTEVA